MSRGVCVLGMMRTGTSAVAGVLELLGVSFGPGERLLEPNVANPSGFREHTGIIALNDELLARLGGAWFVPPSMPEGWHRQPELEDLRVRAREIVATDLAPAEVWAWKDPRTCLTLPFWQDVTPPLSYVACIRDPDEASRSLAGMPWATRNLDHPEQAALDLWLRYTQSALEHMGGHPHVLVFYDELVDDPMHEVVRIARFLRLSERLTPPVRDGIERFVRPSLRHQQQDDGNAGGHPANRLYACIRDEWRSRA